MEKVTDSVASNSKFAGSREVATISHALGSLGGYSEQGARFFEAVESHESPILFNASVREVSQFVPIFRLVWSRLPQKWNACVFSQLNFSFVPPFSGIQLLLGSS